MRNCRALAKWWSSYRRSGIVYRGTVRLQEEWAFQKDSLLWFFPMILSYDSLLWFSSPNSLIELSPRILVPSNDQLWDSEKMQDLADSVSLFCHSRSSMDASSLRTFFFELSGSSLSTFPLLSSFLFLQTLFPSLFSNAYFGVFVCTVFIFLFPEVLRLSKISILYLNVSAKWDNGIKFGKKYYFHTQSGWRGYEYSIYSESAALHIEGRVTNHKLHSVYSVYMATMALLILVSYSGLDGWMRLRALLGS